MSFSDYTFLAIMPTSPPNRTMGIESEVKLDWETVDGAIAYEWQLCDHASFSNILAGFSGTSAAAST